MIDHPSRPPRVFSYLPNPRLWKATITARLSGITLDVVGAPPEALAEWIWDFDARPIAAEERATLHAWKRPSGRGLDGRPLIKTDAFLAAHPFGTIPAAFSPDGRIGVFESNSIMRLVTLLSGDPAGLLGTGPFGMSRVNSFLDASLLFSHDSQRYLLALRSGLPDRTLHAIAARAVQDFLAGIERALAQGEGFLAGATLSLADIGFVCDLALLANESFHSGVLSASSLEPVVAPRSATQFPLAFEHFRALSRHAGFAPDLDAYSDRLAPQPFGLS